MMAIIEAVGGVAARIRMLDAGITECFHTVRRMEIFSMILMVMLVVPDSNGETRTINVHIFLTSFMTSM